MAITQALTTSFRTEIFEGVHNFTNTTGDVFKMALFTSAATLSSATTAYSATNEASGVGYSAGGVTITSATPTVDGTTIVLDFADALFAAVSITARGALIYNSSKSNKAVAVLDFGSDKTALAQNFTVVFPGATASTAIIRSA